jgi:hypothetical protein
MAATAAANDRNVAAVMSLPGELDLLSASVLQAFLPSGTRSAARQFFKERAGRSSCQP